MNGLGESMINSNDILLRKDAAANLRDLVASLPEIYQPIFGHPELSLEATRKGEDRLAHITQIYQSLEAKLNRPLRVLDLGCAQGFFSLSLAKLGATVVGVEFQEPNIAVCNALAAEWPHLKVTFQKEFVEDVIGRLERDQYDLVLGLSIFHHLVHRLGMDIVQKMIFVIAHQTIAGIFELALACEPPAWAASQPQNPRRLLDNYSFVHEFARIRSHLAPVGRPLYIASNHYWFLNGQAGLFTTVKTQSHALADMNVKKTRRYFFGDGLVAKLFTLDDENCRKVNVWEHDNEIAFLNAPPPGFKAPRLLLYGRHVRESWIVREQLPGELLVDRINAGKPHNALLIIQELLKQLSALESAGLYHNDARTWNILIGSDGRPRLIDYGAITKNADDCEWPRNVFLSFMILAHEIIYADAAKPFPLRASALNPDTFDEPYRSLFWDMHNLLPHEWSFARMQDRLNRSLRLTDDHKLSTHPTGGTSLIIQTMGEACMIYRDTIQGLVRRSAPPQDHA
jgi:O-antigen chain-terminating methyltransferase